MEIKVKGLKEIEAQLVALGSKTGTKILRASMLAAARPILSRAQSNAAAIPNGSGSLHKALGMRFFIGNRGGRGELGLPELGGQFSVKIAPLAKEKTAIALHNLYYKRNRKGIYHGHLIEFGHKIKRRTGETETFRGRRGRKYTRHITRELGSVPARPFLRPALDTGGTVAVAILAKELRERIDRQLKKNARRAT
jgi:hypothetical protein